MPRKVISNAYRFRYARWDPADRIPELPTLQKKNLKNFVCRFFFGGEGFSSATGLGFNMGAKFPADLLTSLTGGVRRRGQKQHRCPLPNYDCIRGMRS